jgi:hypothetical protein
MTEKKFDLQTDWRPFLRHLTVNPKTPPAIASSIEMALLELARLERELADLRATADKPTADLAAPRGKLDAS